MQQQPVAIVTGAGRGIGRATAIELAHAGYRVAIVARTDHDLRQTEHLMGGGTVIAADVSDPAAAETIVAGVVQTLGRIDLLVNNAGAAPVLTIEQTSPQQWREVIDTNLSSAFYLCRACWPVFRRQGGGVVVNLSSMAARDPFPGFLAYGSAKAAINLFGLALAREGAAIGVRVHTVAPGAVETAMFRQILTPEQYSPEKTLQPKEVARVILQCARGDLQYTSGEVIYLNKPGRLDAQT